MAIFNFLARDLTADGKSFAVGENGGRVHLLDILLDDAAKVAWLRRSHRACRASRARDQTASRGFWVRFDREPAAATTPGPPQQADDLTTM
jgi:hypothetical protein